MFDCKNSEWLPSEANTLELCCCLYPQPVGILAVGLLSVIDTLWNIVDESLFLYYYESYSEVNKTFVLYSSFMWIFFYTQHKNNKNRLEMLPQLSFILFSTPPMNEIKDLLYE